MESCRDYDEQKQRLLYKWKENQASAATYRALICAIHESGNIDLAHNACELLRQQSSQIREGACSTVSVLSPTTANYQCQLKRGYRTHKPVMVVEWPPPPALKYISLALIQKETVQKGYIKDEFIRMTIHGNLDDILYQKVPIEVEQLFSLDAEKQMLILIEGAPGSGKSTLLWHICQKWQSGELFQQFSLVLLVLLRDTAVHNAQCLADILPHLPSRTSKSSEIRANIALGIEDTHGKGVLIMLDGWDEAPAKLREEGSLFHDIISDPIQCSLEEAVVVVSSRPAASHDLWKYATSRVEVLGFTKERREEYIRESLKNDPQHVKALIHRIESVPELGCSCHLPLNLVIVTHTFISLGNKLPSTYCQVVITLALSCLLRHIRKEKSSVTALKSLNTLPKNIDNGFMKLCQIAYEGIVKEKYSFSVHELTGMPEHESVLESNIPTLGLLQSVHSLVATGSSTVYHFLHLSLQELCAAHYIASLPDPESTHVEALKAMVLEKSSRFDFGAHFQPVCDFYSALTQLKNSEVVDQLMRMYELENRAGFHLLRLLTAQSGRVYANYLFLKCLGQSENSGLVNKIVGKCAEVRVTSISRQAVASVIALATELESLTSSGHFPQLNQALMGNVNLKKLVIKDMDKDITGILATCPKLEHLTIKSLFLPTFADALISSISDAKNKALTTLNISGIGEDGVIAPSSTITTNTAIRELVIDCSNADIHIQSALARAISENMTLSLVIVEFPRHPPSGNDRTLFSCLQRTVALREMKICSKIRRFYDTETRILSNSYVGNAMLDTKHNYNLEISDILLMKPSVVKQTLHIQLFENATVNLEVIFTTIFIFCGLDILKDALPSTSIANFRDKLLPLNTLDISECVIGNAGVIDLSHALHANTTIKRLAICCKQINRTGQQALTEALLHNSSLTTLELKVVNDMEVKLDKNFFNCLKHSKSLTELKVCISDTCIYRALLTGNLVELADILGLNTLPTVDKILHIYEEAHVHIAVDFKNNCFNQLQVIKAWMSRMRSHSRTADDSMDPTDEKDVVLYKNIAELSDLINESSLKEIDISKCRMGDAGLILLSSALTRNNTIQYLKFSCEKISPRGQTSLAEGLSHNSSLVTLELIVHTHPFLENDQIFFRSLKQAKSLTEVKITTIHENADEPSLSNTSVGRALLSGDLVELANILGMNVIPPSVDKTLHLQIHENAYI